MSDLGVALAWTAARATVLAFVGMALYAWAKRRDPAAAARAALASLIALIALSTLAIGPRPRWWSLDSTALLAAPRQTTATPSTRAKLVEERSLENNNIPPQHTVDPPVRQTWPTSAPSGRASAVAANQRGRRSLARLFDELKSKARMTERTPVANRRTGGLGGLLAAPTRPSTPVRPETDEAPASASKATAPSSLREPAAPARAELGGDWPFWRLVAWAYAAGLAIGLSHLGAGLWAVRKFRRKSVPIADRRTRAILDEMIGAMGVRRPIELRASVNSETAATVGWLRPLIMLPANWARWTDAERRAVLAHELAHIERGDYLAWLAARLSLALHFYHPLAYSLAGRLRLQQEIAADAAAARHAGGRKAYLETLARMALRQDVRSAPWPARAFSPRFGTLIRRIEMLRTEIADRRAPSPLAARLVTYGMLVGLGMMLAGFGPKEGRTLGPKAKADGPAQAKAEKVDAPAASAILSLDHVPDDAALVIGIKPSAILKRPEVRSLLDAARGQKELAQILGVIDPQSIEQVTFVLSRSGAMMGDNRSLDPEMLIRCGGAIIRTRSPRDWKALAAAFLPGIVEGRHAGQVYHTFQEDKTNVGFFQPDERTLIVATVPALYSFMTPSRGEHRWAGSWRGVASGELAVAADVGTLLGPFLQLLMESEEFAMIGGTVAPLWEETRGLVFGLDMAEGLNVKVVAACGDDAGARRLERTLQAVLTLGENASGRFFPFIRQKALEEGGGAASLLTAVDVGEQFLAGAKVRRDSVNIHLTMASKVDLSALIRMVLQLR